MAAEAHDSNPSGSPSPRTRPQPQARGKRAPRTAAPKGPHAQPLPLEQAAGAGEERYRVFLAQSSEGIWRYELEQPISVDLPVDEQIELAFRYAYVAECNDAMARMYGHARAEDLIGARLSNLLVRSDPKNTEYLRAFIRSGYRLVDAESHEVDKDGNDRYFLNNFIGVTENGRVLRAWGTQRDITHLKRAEAALRDSEERFRLLFDSVQEGLLLADAATRRFHLANPAMLAMLGYTQDEVASLSIADIHPPAALPRVVEAFEHQRRGEIITAPDLPVRCKDGSVFYADISSKALVLNGSQYVLGVFRDVTERRRAEEALRNSEARYRALAENAQDFIFSLNREGRIEYVNQFGAHEFGCQPSALIGKLARDLFPPEIARRQGENAARVFQTGQPVVLENETRFPTHTAWLNTWLIPIRDESGAVRSILGISRDLTKRKQAEEALRASEERYRAFIAQSTEGIWRFELEEPIPVNLPVEEQIDRYYRSAYLAECNDAMARMYGYARADEMVGVRIGEILVRSDERNVEHVRKLIRDGYRVSEEESHELDSAGNLRYFLNNVIGVIEDGLLRRFWGTQRDITERRKIEEALRESEARYRLLFECNPLPMYLVDHLSYRFLAVNESAVRQYGYSRDEFLAMTVKDIRPPEDLPAMLEFAARIKPGTYTGPTPLRHRRKDGTLIDVEVTVYCFEQAGRPIALSLAHDVTERKRAQEALVTESARLRVMLEQMPAVLWTTDCGLRITSAAGTGLAAVGEKPANTVGRPLADFVRPRGDDQRLMAAHQRALAGEPVSFEDSWHKRTFQAHVEPLREAGGRITGVIGLALDVTDAKRAEEEHRALERRLQEAQKLESLGVLAGGIAHDFNNLLAAILGNVSLANMQLAADAPVRPYLQSVEVVAQRAAELCKQMLAYAGRGRFVVQLINVNTIINEMANLLRVSIGKGVNLRFDLAPALPLVSADATQIRQVVMNLILNASEAVGDRTGAICLSTGLTRMTRAQLAQTVLAPDLPDGDYAFLEVTDTGCGMDAETLARIFDPFFSTKFTGRGLGLAAVLGIVRGHRGAINVESTPGRGSTFRVCLPCGPVGPPELPAQAPARPRLQGTILLVDDDETLRTVEARLLEANGLRVLLAGNGREGIEVLKAHAADVRVVLLDMGMPGLSTEETYRAMEDVRPGLPMVLLSGYDQQERASQRGDRARTRFLQKPCPPQALLDALTALMAGA